MDWQRAIKRNREALVQIVANLFSMAGISAGEKEPPAAPALSAEVRRGILLILRPAESALRRLIVIAAHGRTFNHSPRKSALPDFAGFSKAKSDKRSAFPLFDRRKRFVELSGPVHSSHISPRVSFPGVSERVFAPNEAPKPVSEKRLTEILLRRLTCFEHALQNLPRQVERLLRVEVRNHPPHPTSLCSATLSHQGRGENRKCLPPLRPGTPPGHRKKSLHVVDDVLKECHALARDVALVPP